MLERYKKGMETAQALIGKVDGIKRDISKAFRSDVIDGDLYSRLMQSVQGMEWQVRVFAIRQEQLYKQQGGNFYEPGASNKGFKGMAIARM